MPASSPHAGADSQSDAGHGWVFASHLSRHVRHLADATGTPWRVLAHLAGVPSSTVATMVTPGRPRARIRTRDAQRLLRLTPETVWSAEHTMVAAAATVNRIQALRQAGHPHRRIADYLNLSDQELRPLAAGEQNWCTLMVKLRAQAACEAHNLWWSEADDHED